MESNLEVLNSFKDITELSSCGLLLAEWLNRCDASLSHRAIMLFDGLDTGFGTSEDDRNRRRAALEGLFDLWIDRGAALKNLRFKIVLREDIWRKLSFENKSHLFGRSVKLQWNNQAEYFKIALKQALRSPTFVKQFEQLRESSSVSASGIDRWTAGEVSFCWNLLVGERMKGGKTTFTRNWVWNRLADGNDDHTPRYLLQLFQEVTRWERHEAERTPYPRSVIRPWALIMSLPTVSEQALEALYKEEFLELSPLIRRLRNIGKTPIPAEDLAELNEEVALAREVGLLSVYEGTEEQVVRYKVPDIYRHALEMTRKGQA
jgi:hypothetical protein